MKDLPKWILMHSLHWAVLYGAFAAQLDGALNLLMFWVWAMAPVSLFLLTDLAIAFSAEKPPKPIRSTLSMLQAWVTLGLLVWGGHVATALAWGLVMIVVAAHISSVRKVRAAVASRA